MNNSSAFRFARRTFLALGAFAAAVSTSAFCEKTTKIRPVNSLTTLLSMKGPSVQPPNRPNTCTYWVTENVLAGEYPGGRITEETDKRLRQFLQSGITYFIDLTHPGEKADYQQQLQLAAKQQGIQVDYKRLSIPDFGIPNDASVMKEILDSIDDAVSNKHKVYVHCRGGIGRTGTVVGCFLVRHGNNGQDALEEVNRLFQTSDRRYESPCSPETQSQIDFVRNWRE